jgi:hypothetical protein
MADQGARHSERRPKPTQRAVEYWSSERAMAHQTRNKGDDTAEAERTSPEDAKRVKGNKLTKTSGKLSAKKVEPTPRQTIKFPRRIEHGEVLDRAAKKNNAWNKLVLAQDDPRRMSDREVAMALLQL